MLKFFSNVHIGNYNIISGVFIEHDINTVTRVFIIIIIIIRNVL